MKAVRTSRLLGLVLVFTMLMTGVALADKINAIDPPSSVTVGTPVQVDFWVEDTGGSCDGAQSATLAFEKQAAGWNPATAGDVSPLTQLVNFSGCTVDNKQTATFTILAAGTYKAKFINPSPTGLNVNPAGFEFTATAASTPTNTAPTVNAFTPTLTGACVVNVSATFVDPDDDSWTASINWDDPDGTPVAGTVNQSTKTVTGSHTYAESGTYTIKVTVDDGTDSGFNTAQATTKLAASSFLQPINTDGTRSAFRRGSTVPVKITVEDCAGDEVSTVSPTVHLRQVNVDGELEVDVETVENVAPTNGKNMRWSSTDSQYIFNLSTKKSQFNNNKDLVAGTYRLTVTDQSFFSNPTVLFDLR